MLHLFFKCDPIAQSQSVSVILPGSSIQGAAQLDDWSLGDSTRWHILGGIRVWLFGLQNSEAEILFMFLN